ncbi:MAG TPA: right-handed parallel beta-helix repeat-containing protein [Allosphingosinicella sp.]|nr:right-handed parallel beta-helix repeat-containing protein [Allosphingosinicella sp.]
MAADLAIKEPCRVATTGNITLSGLQTIDGVALAANDRVLVRAQTTATQNGIYLAASGSWTRATDFDGAGEVAGGTAAFVTSGTRFADSTWRVAGDGAVTPGSSSIAFDPEFLQAGTGAAPRSAARKLGEAPVTPEDFGAVGDGHLAPGSSTDDTAAVQAAMDEAAASGRPLYLKKMYKVTDTITWQKLGDSQGPIVFGDGRLSSGLAPYQIDGPVLRIDGSSLAPYRYARGGHLHDFRIFPGFVNGTDRGQGFFDSGTDTTGIELIGFLYGSIERIEVHGLTGTAIAAPRRTDLESPNYESPPGSGLFPAGFNSDGYQTAAEVKQCDLRHNGGWGVDGDAGIGCTLSLFDNNVIFNEKGGVRLGGGAWRVIRNAIAQNGSPSHGGGGILVDVINGTAHTPEIYNNEIESNYAYGVDFKAATNPRLIQNRFNASSLVWPADNMVRPPIGVRAGFVASYAVTGLQAEQNEFRDKVSGGDPDSAITAWQLDCGTGRCTDADILKSRYSSSSANLTRYAKGGGARLQPTVVGGVVTGVTVLDGGQGYSGTIPVNAVGGGGTGFVGTATLTGDAISGVTISNGGSGYSSSTTGLAARPAELQGFNFNDSIRIRHLGYARNTGGPSSFKSRLATGNIEPTTATVAAKKIIFASEESDFPLYHDAITGEFTFPFTGNWWISVTLTTDLGAAGSVNIWAYVDGVQTLKETHRVSAAGDNSFTLDGQLYAVGGGKLTIHADNSTGVAKAVTGGVTCNRFSVALAD